MRGPVPLLLLAALAVTALSGCIADSGGGEGLTAKAAAGQASAEASAWADDAVLVSLFGVERADAKPAAPADGEGDAGEGTEAPGAQADLLSVQGYSASVSMAGSAAMGMPWALGDQQDDVLGDGKLPAWGAFFVSPSQSASAFVHVNSTGAHLLALPKEGKAQASASAGGQGSGGATASAESGDAEAAIAKARENYGRWSVDSSAAIRSVRNGNATLEAAFAAGEAGKVSYEIEFVKEAAWRLDGELATAAFDAVIDATSGEVLTSDVGVVMPPPPPLPLPDPIHEEGDVAAGADPFNAAGLPPCSTPAAQCVEFEFTVARAVVMDATLTFDQAASDFDVYVYDEGGDVVASGASGAGVEESLSADLDAGTYTVQVVPWSVASDHWAFDATFS